MKQHLLDMFQFNGDSNRKMIATIMGLPQPDEAASYMSHIINSQIKWLKRISVYPEPLALDWWLPAYPLGELETRLDESNKEWLAFLESKSENAIGEEVRWIGDNGAGMAAKLQDVALQLIFHSFHHRAQIQKMIRAQGIEPKFIDYIGARFHRLQQTSRLPDR